MNTNDLSGFGRSELSDAAELLKLLSENRITQRVRDSFGHNNVRLELNLETGMVFLTDDDCNSVMLNEDLKLLDLWIFTPDDGREGFFDDLLNEYFEMTRDDMEFMKNYDTDHVIDELTDMTPRTD